MKISHVLSVVLAALFAAAILIPTTAEAGRKGSKRVGGHNSHGKGSHYVGGR